MFRNNQKTYLGHGYSLETPGRVKKITIKDADRKGHLFGFGSTRIGKTRLIELMMEQDIRMARCRKKLDWEGQINTALDPERARSMRNSRKPEDEDVCTMCGEFCAIKVLNQEKSWEFYE